MDLPIANEFARADSPVMSQTDAPEGEIAFATGTSALGIVLAACSQRSICAILIGSEAGELTADLAARFPENTLVQDDRKLDGDLRKILRFIESPAELDLELDIYGTPFQLKVWKELLRIRSGSVETYATVAEKISEPRAMRAVGSAVGRNTVSIVVPCHRVVNKDSARINYGWGPEIKRALLKKEGARV